MDTAKAVILFDGKVHVALHVAVADVDVVEARRLKLVPRHPERAVILIFGAKPRLYNIIPHVMHAACNGMVYCS